MENFIVSARKYRPQTFDTVVGQMHITSTLKNAIRSNHVAQAYLFCGPRGVGKTTCARILAKTINCFDRTKDIEACDECDSCKSFNSGHSLNIYELDAASNNSVDDIRNLINQVSFSPQLGSHKIYIIDEVHMLSQAAFNAFLKTLEEPPKHAIFILATTEKHKIIPTILSRCQIFDFNRIRIEDTVSHLISISKKEKVKAEEDALHIIAQKADGAMRDALSIFDQMVSLSNGNISYKTVIDNLNILDYDYYFKITNAILAKNTSASLLIYNDILNKGFDGHNFLNGLAEHFRNLLVSRDEATLQLMETSTTIRDQYKVQSKNTELEFLLRGLNMLNKADAQYKASRNQRLLVELTLLQLCSLQGSASVLSSKTPVEEKKNDILEKPAQEQATTKSYHAPIPVSTTETEPISAIETTKAVVPSPAINSSIKNTASGKSSIKSVLSISSMKNDKPLLSALSTDGKENGIHSPLEKSTQPGGQGTDLMSAWNVYAESLKKKNKINLYSTFTAKKPVLENDLTISFSVLNHVQEDEINSVKTDLLFFLRSEMNVAGLQLNILVDKNEVERKPYTGEEKYQRLAEKNPSVTKLRQQFNLEIEL